MDVPLGPIQFTSPMVLLPYRVLRVILVSRVLLESSLFFLKILEVI